jgi:moderate conductance mechanosensitive channel
MNQQEGPQSTLESLRQQLVGYFNSPELWVSFFTAMLYIIVILVISRLVLKVANRGFEHMLIARERSPLKVNTRRSNTIGKLIRNILTYTVNFITILLILGQIGVKLGPLLAGAGVVGLAIGFGAQSLVKDVITGFFIIFEDQFAVGDVIQTGTYKGTVEEIGLRITRIRSWTGEVYVIPNGSITQVTNFSIHNSLAVVDIPVDSKLDIDTLLLRMNETVQQLYSESELIVAAPEVQGIQTLGKADVVLRIVAECKPNENATVVREMNARLKKALETVSV